jgi:UTP:GlnB (protein PII) uridylyltransferase
MSATEQTNPAALSKNSGNLLTGRTLKMITDDFDERTIANMEVALDRACERFPKELATHEARKRVAARILESARGGERTLKGLTEAAMLAAILISSRKIRSHHPPLNGFQRMIR